MMSEEEFKSKIHIILDKPCWTFVMEKVLNKWYVRGIYKAGCFEGDIQEVFTDDEAYEFYLRRMESFGFKMFPILSE